MNTASFTLEAPALPMLGNALVLRQAQDEGEFYGRSVEILILSLSKDEDFFLPPFEQTGRAA